jgi:hypothetical protein
MVKDAILFVEYLEGAESRKTSYHASLQPLQLSNLFKLVTEKMVHKTENGF